MTTPNLVTDNLITGVVILFGWIAAALIFGAAAYFGMKWRDAEMYPLLLILAAHMIAIGLVLRGAYYLVGR